MLRVWTGIGFREPDGAKLTEPEARGHRKGAQRNLDVLPVGGDGNPRAAVHRRRARLTCRPARFEIAELDIEPLSTRGSLDVELQESVRAVELDAVGTPVLPRENRNPPPLAWTLNVVRKGRPAVVHLVGVDGNRTARRDEIAAGPGAFQSILEHPDVLKLVVVWRRGCREREHGRRDGKRDQRRGKAKEESPLGHITPPAPGQL